MSNLHVEWDAEKSATNRRKHGVSFDEASTVFYDENALFMADPKHSETEDRFLLLGMSFKPRVLVVCHCYRGKEDTIRIISARRADRSEREQYSWRRRR